MSSMERSANDRSQMEVLVTAFKGHVIIKLDRSIDVMALSPEHATALADMLYATAGKAAIQSGAIVADS